MDTLMRTKKLEALGFDRPQAEGLVLMVKASIDEEVAKKGDLQRVETGIKLEMGDLRNDLKRVETSLRTEIERVETSLRTEIERVETGLRIEIERVETVLRSDISDFRSEMKIQHQDLLLYCGGLMVTLSGIVTGVLIGVLKN